MAILVVDAACLAAGMIRHVILHAVVVEMSAEAASLAVMLPCCETRLPARFCTCGQYALVLEDVAAPGEDAPA